MDLTKIFEVNPLPCSKTQSLNNGKTKHFPRSFIKTIISNNLVFIADETDYAFNLTLAYKLILV